MVGYDRSDGAVRSDVPPPRLHYRLPAASNDGEREYTEIVQRLIFMRLYALLRTARVDLVIGRTGLVTAILLVIGSKLIVGFRLMLLVAQSGSRL